MSDDVRVQLMDKKRKDRGLSQESLAASLYLSRSTLHNRLKHPSSTTVDDLRLMAEVLKFSDAEIVKFVKGV